jgi:hypothetical protein
MRLLRPALLLAATGALAIGMPAAAKPPPQPDRVQARGVEFDLTLSKQKVRPGRVIIQFLNDGEDPHDLRVQQLNDPTAQEFGVGQLEAGEYENVDAWLRKRATYMLWCSISDHRGRGMEAVLRTKKRRRPSNDGP